LSTFATPASISAPVVCAGLVVADHLCPPLDHLPKAGELIAVDELVLNVGGGAANTAVDLARLGITAAVRARVGDDIFGRFAIEFLKEHHVETGALLVDPELATSQTLVVNVRGEDRRFIHCVGANAGFTAADLDVVLEHRPRVLHIGYFLILPRLDAGALAQRFAHARQGGTFTVLDVATPGRGNYLDPLKVVLPHTDLFVPNTDEAELILGERGLVSVSKENRVKLGAYSVSFVDGSGGGDAFNAGYIAGVLEGQSELDCLKLASAVGASCVRSVGTTAGVFTRAEAEEFIKLHPLLPRPIA